MNEPRDQALPEILWRRPVTPAERRAWTAGSTRMRNADWVLEERLTRALTQLPDLPVATNFTARVLAALPHEPVPSLPARVRLAHGWVARWWRWLAPATALLLIVGGAGLVWQWRQAAARADLARDIATMSRVTELAPPEAFGEFEIINRLGGPPLPDEELLAVMQ